MERISQSETIPHYPSMRNDEPVRQQVQPAGTREALDPVSADSYLSSNDRQRQSCLLKQTGKRLGMAASDELPGMADNTEGPEADSAFSAAAKAKRRRENKAAAKIAAAANRLAELEPLIYEARTTEDINRLRKLADPSQPFDVLKALTQNPCVTPDMAAAIVNKLGKGLHVIIALFAHRLDIVNDNRYFRELVKRYRAVGKTQLGPFANCWIDYMKSHPAGIRDDFLREILQVFRKHRPYQPDLFAEIEAYLEQSENMDLIPLQRFPGPCETLECKRPGILKELESATRQELQARADEVWRLLISDSMATRKDR